MYEAHQEAINPEEKVVYAGDAARRLTTLITALNTAKLAYKQLGEKLQWHLDDQLASTLPVLGISRSYRYAISSEQFPLALEAVREAAVLAGKQRSSYGPDTHDWSAKELCHPACCQRTP